MYVVGVPYYAQDQGVSGWDSLHYVVEVCMPKNGGGAGWKWDEDSKSKVMPEKWTNLLDWLLQGPDRVPKFQKDWAKENGIHEDSVRRIKRDMRFMKEWVRRAAELNIHPERTQSVIDSLHSQAVGGSVQAAALYLQYIEKVTPRRKIVVEDRDAAAMSDNELADELEAQVHHLRVVEDG